MPELSGLRRCQPRCKLFEPLSLFFCFRNLETSSVSDRLDGGFWPLPHGDQNRAGDETGPADSLPTMNSNAPTGFERNEDFAGEGGDRFLGARHVTIRNGKSSEGDSAQLSRRCLVFKHQLRRLVRLQK